MLRLLTRIVITYFSLVLLLSVAYMLVPPISTLMLGRWVTLQKVQHDYVPLKNVSRNLVRAVIAAEDSGFCDHWGIDWKSMGDALDDASSGERSRGASTVTMQVAKNLFLWPSRSYLRKALEVPIAFYIDLLWSKKRIMEVYLSVAEWGDGIYGAQAASLAYFNKPASQLTEWEAALLAAALPNPVERAPNHPSGYHAGYAGKIARRMNTNDLSCF